MMVELYTAAVRNVLTFNNHHEILNPQPEIPKLVGFYHLGRESDGDSYLIGRDPGEEIGSPHRSWPTTGPNGAEDTYLSRNQLELTRVGDRWEVWVPPGGEGKVHATVQYWASTRTYKLSPGVERHMLSPGKRAGIVVRTQNQFYWAMLTVPAVLRRANAAVDGWDTGKSAPSRSKVTLPYTNLSSVDDGSGSAQTADIAGPKDLPWGWADAIRVKFEPYLTWPMGWQPRLVPPSKYMPQPRTFRFDRSDQAVSRGQGAYDNLVKKRIRLTAAWAMNRGHSGPLAVEPGILDWLVENEYLSFEEHHCEWRDIAYDE